MIQIKVVLLTPYYYPIVGGITSFVGNLQNSLSKKGIIVSIVTGQGVKNESVEVVGAKKLAYLIKAFLYLRRKKPDIIHSQSHWYIMFACVLYRIFHPNTKLQEMP